MINLSPYSLDRIHNNDSLDSVSVIAGLIIGTCLCWCFRDICISLFADYSPQLVETVIYVLGTIVVISLTGSRFFRWPSFYRSLLLLLSIIAILLYGNALELEWVRNEKDYFLIGGIVPASDAGGWLAGGWRLLALESLLPTDQRRVVNAALYALRIFLTGDIHTNIYFGTIVAGTAAIFFSWVVRGSLGWIASAVVFFLSLELIRDHLPLTMTEIHGFILGCLSLGILWKAAVTRSTTLYCLGLVLLTLGLNARAGPFLVLPAVIVWGMVNLDSVRRISYIPLVFGLLAVAVGFVVPRLFIYLWGDIGTSQHANFSLTLYGMAVGGKGWLQAFSDHPGLLTGPEGGLGFGGTQEAHIAKELYKIAIRNILTNPIPFISYYLREILEFNMIFAKYDLGVNRLLMVVSALWLLKRWREPLSQLLMVIYLGVLFSAPFLMDDAGTRPFAPIYPLIAVVSALPVALLCRYVCSRLSDLDDSWSPVRSPKGTIVLGFVALAIVTFGPILAVENSEPETSAGTQCLDGEIGIILSKYLAASVNVLGDDYEGVVLIPNIKHSQFIETFPHSQRGSYKIAVSKATTPFVFASALIPETKRREYFLIDGTVDFAAKSPYLVCFPSVPEKEIAIRTGYLAN